MLFKISKMGKKMVESIYAEAFSVGEAWLNLGSPEVTVYWVGGKEKDWNGKSYDFDNEREFVERFQCLGGLDVEVLSPESDWRKVMKAMMKE
jgi:hypothetical protein